VPIQAIVFDMDGVLIDSEPIWNEVRVAFAAACRKPWTEDLQRSVMGVSTQHWGEVMREGLGCTLSTEQVIAEVGGRMIDRYRQHLPLLPGALESVRLAASAYPVALASGSMSMLIDHVLDATGLRPLIGVVVYGDTVARGKPAPDIYLEAAQRLGVPPAACVGVEDSVNGLRALRAAGMKAIAVASPQYPLGDVAADARLSSLEEFSLDLVRGLG
jgi:beta-phosphoglucomutase-like phosphatase (HAD superfamily)